MEKNNKKGVRKLEKGNPTNPDNRVEEKYLEGDLRTKAVYYAIDLFKVGLTKAIVRETIINDKEFSSLSEVETILIEALSEVSEQFVTKNDHLIGLHLERYNREVERLINKDFSAFGPLLERKIKSGAYMDVLDTLHQKEKLLQLHSKQTVIRFNQRNSININEIESKFDLQELDFEEKRRLMELLLKSKTSDGDEVISVILNDKDDNVIDIDSEVIVESPDTVNIAKIEQLDNTVNEKQYKAPVGLEEIKRKLSIALEKAAEKELIKVGSKSVRGESGEL